MVPDAPDAVTAAFRKLATDAPVIVAAAIESVFNRAAKCWVDGSNSGNSETYRQKCHACDLLRRDAEELLAVLGECEVDYPGLYPSFRVNGYSEYCVLGVLKNFARLEVA